MRPKSKANKETTQNFFNLPMNLTFSSFLVCADFVSNRYTCMYYAKLKWVSASEECEYQPLVVATFELQWASHVGTRDAAVCNCRPHNQCTQTDSSDANLFNKPAIVNSNFAIWQTQRNIISPNVSDSDPLGPLCENMTSSTKPCNLLHCCQRRTEPLPQFFLLFAGWCGYQCWGLW